MSESQDVKDILKRLSSADVVLIYKCLVCERTYEAFGPFGPKVAVSGDLTCTACRVPVWVKDLVEQKVESSLRYQGSRSSPGDKEE